MEEPSYETRNAASPTTLADKYEQRLRESWKLGFESYKHLTTLSAGAIVLLAGFLEQLLRNPYWSFMVPATFILFWLSVLFSVLSMNRLDELVAYVDDKKRARQARIFTNLAWVFFVLAILGVAICAITNFYIWKDPPTIRYHYRQVQSS